MFERKRAGWLGCLLREYLHRVAKRRVAYVSRLWRKPIPLRRHVPQLFLAAIFAKLNDDI
jgi:hypothetical protein